MFDDTLTPEYEAVRHILGSPVVWRRAEPYVGADDVAWTGLLAEAETMSGGEALLVRIAHDLWHAERGVSLAEIPRRLDYPNFRRVLEGLRICRGSFDLSAGGMTARPEEIPARAPRPLPWAPVPRPAT